MEGQHQDETTRPCIIAIVGHDYSFSRYAGVCLVETLEAGGVGSDESEIRSTCNGGERGGLEAVCIYLQYIEWYTVVD